MSSKHWQPVQIWLRLAARLSMALGGAQGVQSVFEQIDHELEIIMQLAGTKTIEDVKHAPLTHFNYAD